MAKHRAHVAEIVNALPPHADFVKQYAGASPDAWKIVMNGDIPDLQQKVTRLEPRHLHGAGT